MPSYSLQRLSIPVKQYWLDGAKILLVMPKKIDISTSKNNSFDPLIQSENIAFAPSDLILCGVCGRQNPPTRLKCLYCGQELKIDAENLKKVRFFIRPMESWERGFNIIVREGKAIDTISIPDVATLISQSIDDVDAILASSKRLPLARVESLKDAEIMTVKLASLGLICQVVSDETLATDQPPARLAGIEIGNESITFIAFLTLERTEILFSDLALIIPGFLSHSKTDLVEKRQRKGSEVFEEVESSVHDAIVDVYSRTDPRGYRIQLAGFDFSCLGSEKGFLAGENIKRLIELLTRLAKTSKLVDDYVSVRQLLSHIWEVERRSDPQGMKRLGFGKTGLQRVETTSNLQQFTKYSRLQWHLYEQERIAEEAKTTTVTAGEKSAAPAKTGAP